MMTSACSPPGSSAQAHPLGRRHAARVRLGIPAKIILLSGTYSCRLDDLSQTGARVAIAASQPSPGMSAILTVNGLEVLGTIKWGRAQRYGLQFDEPLPLQQVIAIRHFSDSYTRYEAEQFQRNAREFVQGRRGTI